MGIKLEEKYIKSKIKDKFGEIEVYNPQHDSKILEQLTKMITDNSKQVQLENEKTDIEVTNTVEIMRFMLTNLTNIESNTWDNINDVKLEEMLNLANGDFKKVVNSLLDIMIEIGNDIVIQNIRKLNILNNKLLEMSESIKANEQIDKTLGIFGLDKEKLIKLQNGDEETIRKFQKNLIETQINKSKRGRPKKSNK